MRIKKLEWAALACAVTFTAIPALADQPGAPVRSDTHAPIGVMGDHTHKAGEWMVSYRYMHMAMKGSRIGTNAVTPAQIATTVPNRFFGRPMQPPTLRVVPTSMTMDMHMVGLMYAPSDWLTLMAMAMYVEKEMDHVTFMGGAGTTTLGTFTTRSDGIGDAKFSGLIRLYEDDTHHLHFNAGVSLPTGSIKKTDDILTPMGMRPTVRLPYPMQIGSGTVDLLPGITYSGLRNALGWGAQYLATIRVDDNGQAYALGDSHALTAWASVALAPWISASVRVAGETRGRISGIDPMIAAPVQTADPDFQGGDRVDLFFGFNLVGQSGFLRGHRLAVEIGFPVYQKLNGPQMETDWRMTVGYQKAF